MVCLFVFLNSDHFVGNVEKNEALKGLMFFQLLLDDLFPSKSSPVKGMVKSCSERDPIENKPK